MHQRLLREGCGGCGRRPQCGAQRSTGTEWSPQQPGPGVGLNLAGTRPNKKTTEKFCGFKFLNLKRF